MKQKLDDKFKLQFGNYKVGRVQIDDDNELTVAVYGTFFADYVSSLKFSNCNMWTTTTTTIREGWGTVTFSILIDG